MSVNKADNRYVILMNANNLSQTTSHIWVSPDGGDRGDRENSLFYMGFSKNFNKVIRATKYNVSNGDLQGGTGCCVEFAKYDKGYEGPMISQKVQGDFHKSWLNVVPGQSQQIGVYPVNIALHTYVDNDYIAAQALAQAWLLKNANKVSGEEHGPENSDHSKKPCVYRRHDDIHLKDKPSCIKGLSKAQNRILYNSISTLRKHAYSHKYDNFNWNSGQGYDILDCNGNPRRNMLLKDIGPRNASNCMNTYEEYKNYGIEWNNIGATNEWKSKYYKIPINYRYETKSYGGGYVSLHHLHFTTVGNTTGANPANGTPGDTALEKFYQSLSFYIPRSTGEAATEIPLSSGYYDTTTNTTHYWVYFNNNRKDSTLKSYFDDDWAESGWSYDSPVNIPVGKLYSTITPVAWGGSDSNSPELPKIDPCTNYYTDSALRSGSSKSADTVENENAAVATTRYVASFTTSFNIYIACKDTSRNRGNNVLGANPTVGSITYNIDDESVDKNDIPENFTLMTEYTVNGQQQTVFIEDDIPYSEQETDETDESLNNENQDPYGVQIASITGFLVDYTWAYSKIRTNFKNLEQVISDANNGNLLGRGHVRCVNIWDSFIETPRMYGLLVLQHCCSDANIRYMGGTSLAYADDKISNSDSDLLKKEKYSYYPGKVYASSSNSTSTNVYIKSSYVETLFKMNTGSTISSATQSSFPHLAPTPTGSDNDRWKPSLGLYNVIKISNNNAKYNIPDSNDHVNLTTPCCHNKGLYTNGSKMSPIFDSNGASINNGAISGQARLNPLNYNNTEYYVNHYVVDGPDINRITDCGVLFNSSNQIACHDIRLNKLSSGNNATIIYKTEEPNINPAASNSNDTDYFINEDSSCNSFNADNVPYITGKLGRIPEFKRKYKAKFSIVKNSVRINGISLNKMATKFPLEARSKEVPNIITFKMKIAFKYFYGKATDKDEYYDAQGSPGPHMVNIDYNEIAPQIFGGFDDESHSAIMYNDTRTYSKVYGVGQGNVLIPAYKSYEDDLLMDSVGTIKEIILPARYDEKTFPYYNIALRLPLTAIDNNFSHELGNNKFVGAPCYDVTDDNTVFEYINEDSSICTIDAATLKTSDDPVLRGIKYEFKILQSDTNPDDNESETISIMLKFYNDSDIFGFLDFYFKVPNFTFKDSSNREWDFTIEGSAILSNLMNKIIIKGKDFGNTNEIIFSDSNIKTTLKKTLNTDVSPTITDAGGTAVTSDIPEGAITSLEENFDFNSKNVTMITVNNEPVVTDKDYIESIENGVMNIGATEADVKLDPANIAVIDRITGEVVGVGNDALINYNEYGQFIGYNDDSSAGQGKNLGMKNVEGRCLTNNLMPVLSNKITVY